MQVKGHWSQDKKSLLQRLHRLQKCEKTCKFDAVHVVDNVAMIDPEKCKNCGMCAKECPTGAIINLRAKRKPAMPEMQPEIAEA